MNILVTGGAGYIGSHTVLKLLAAGHHVIVVDNLSNSSEESLVRVERISGKKPTFYKLDLNNKASLSAIFANEGIDAVIHFAGLKAVGESVAHPLEYYRNNLLSTVNLCEVMANHNVKQLVFSSSATVYGNPAHVPVTELMPLSATNPYGRTKLMSEQILNDLTVSDKGWKITVLRYFNPAGAHESGLIGEDPLGPPDNLVPYISQVAAGVRERLIVLGNDYDTPDGTGIRDYLHVQDLAEAHLCAIERLVRNDGLAIYNLGTGKGYSVLEVLASFEKASGKKILYEIGARRTGDIAICYADPSKAQHHLGWKAVKSLDEMCTDAWRWQSLNPHGYHKG